ncbi:MAG: hypothetical protein RRY99_09540 [Flavobacterium sp.]
MAILLKQFNGSTVSAQDDAILYDLQINENGIIRGCELTFLGANQVRLSEGRGILKGRIFVIEEETLLVAMSNAGSKKGRIFLHMDLLNTGEPIKIQSIVESTLPVLVENEKCNYESGVYELELATYSANEIAINNLVSTFKIIKNEATEADIAAILDGTWSETKNYEDPIKTI